MDIINPINAANALFIVFTIFYLQLAKVHIFSELHNIPLLQQGKIMKKSPFICKYAKKVVPLQADYAFLRNNG
jgi:hypothetical protein